MNAKQRRKASRTVNEFLPVVRKMFQTVINAHLNDWERPEVTKDKVIAELKNCLKL